MSTVVETIKELIGETSSNYDFIYAITSSVLIVYTFGSLLRVIGYILGGQKK